MIDLDFLEKVAVFKKLDDGQLSEIQKFCEEAAFNRGERLFAEGETSSHIWILVEGQVDLRFDRPEGSTAFDKNPISFISGADLFGWASFVPPYKFHLSGYCASRKCRVIKLPKEKLVDLFRKDYTTGYQVMSYVLRVIGTHFNQFQEEYAKTRGHNIMSGW